MEFKSGWYEIDTIVGRYDCFHVVGLSLSSELIVALITLDLWGSQQSAVFSTGPMSTTAEFRERKNSYADEVIFYYNSLSSGQSITLLKASILARQIFEKWPELCEICFDKQYLVKLKWSITNSICLR